MLRFVCFALLACLISAGIPYEDCGNAEVKSLEVSSCTSAPCTLRKGTVVTITVVFTANQDTRRVTIQIMAKIGALEVPILGIDPNGCNGYVECPIKKGEIYTLKYKVSVPLIIPNVEADLTAKLVGDIGLLSCIAIHGSIKDFKRIL